MSGNHTDKASTAYMVKLVSDLENRIETLEKQREQRKVLWTRPTPPTSNNNEESNEESVEGQNCVKQENGVGKDITLDLEVKNATTTPGQNVYVTGNLKELGQWVSANALKLTTSTDTYPAWSGSVTVHDYKGEPIQFKFFKMTDNNQNDIQWDSHADNYTITATDNSKQSFTWTN